MISKINLELLVKLEKRISNFVYYFFAESDFNNNYIYFIISEIICLIISFFGCIYNEYIILFCCGLEKETQEVVSLKAYNEIVPLSYIDISEKENDKEDKEGKRESYASVENYTIMIENNIFIQFF